MEITSYYFIPRNFMEAIHHIDSDGLFDYFFNMGWVNYREADGVYPSDSYAMWIMGGEL